MIDILEQVALAPHTTLGVGGKADYLVIAKTRGELLEALGYAHSNKIPFVVIGGGSNVLVSDNGYRGIVIVNKATKHELKKDTVIVESGANLTKVASQVLDEGYLGLEFAIGIPGTIGGAVAGNVGTPKGAISDVLVSAEIWHNGKIIVMDGDSLDFDYRYSNIKGKPNFVVLSAKFRIQEGSVGVAKAQVREDLKRRSNAYKGRTVGSYFKNPREGKTAAELIDSLGLKGYQIGGAEVTNEHANVFRNRGDAVASDFYKLEMYVISRVMEKYDIVLETEVVKIGDFA